MYVGEIDEITGFASTIRFRILSSLSLIEMSLGSTRARVYSPYVAKLLGSTQLICMAELIVQSVEYKTMELSSIFVNLAYTVSALFKKYPLIVTVEPGW